MPDVVAQAVSIVPPQIVGAATPTQQTLLAGTGGLSPRVVLQAAVIAPGVRSGTVTLAQQSTLAGTLRQAPRVVAMAVPGSTLAGQSTQTGTLAAVGGTGPQPRSIQRSTLLARGQLETPGGFAFPVPQRTLAASGLLTLHGAATMQSYTWLVAGIIGVHKSATGTQQQSATGTGLVVFPRFGAARPTSRSTLAGTAQVRHPIAVLAAPLWLARLVGQSSLLAHGLIAALRGHYHTARGLGGGRAAYQTARGLGALGYVYQSRRAQGEDVAAIPVPPTPRLVYLRSRERNVPYQIDFARDLGAGDSVSSAAVTVLAQPLEQEGVAPTDVTSSVLVSSAASGTVVSAVLGKATALPGTEYTVRIVATMQSGMVLQETIGGGPESRIVCDM